MHRAELSYETEYQSILSYEIRENHSANIKSWPYSVWVLVDISAGSSFNRRDIVMG
jgi:hypothetical protein